MNETLPSLSGMRAFEAAARHLSMTLAAEELHVTPGAISLQVRELEATLGLALFERHPRRLSLTEAGADYFSTLRIAFRLMREATGAIRRKLQPDIVTLSCTTGFAIQWLMPRLEEFQTAFSEIDLRIGTTGRLVDFQKDGVDLAVRHGLGAYPGLASERLVADDLIAVCSPALAATLGPDPTPSRLKPQMLIHDVDRNDWRLWLEAAGATDIDWRRGPVIAPDSNGALEAARAGLGLALLRQGFAEQDIRQGRLVSPFSTAIRSRFAYYLVYPSLALERSAVATVRQWLVEESSRSEGLAETGSHAIAVT
ncbi:transcriptional regulator [Rhizobium sp. ACO-34A]|nr:transcriptional regulator GcvA [Rhizobium sp. ACO-34A]ATN32717.1 transcriptional regulator [Rhizobium sp. ACO-34A]